MIISGGVASIRRMREPLDHPSQIADAAVFACPIPISAKR
jgi:hypothetical protein